ncbi:MAG: 3-dehydroquinate synthase [Alphaproteobacteria bacterium]|jgi:3-dehydroquinate synthase|nr:3-dehydroquinate synthase [Alphaproteobacteria bacterium]
MNSEFETLNVGLGQRSYDILVGERLLQQAGALIRPVLARPRCVLITDENVEQHWLETVENSLDTAGIEYQSIVLEPGEQTKDYGHVEALTGQLLDARAERSTTLIALGGGVVGDLVGFCAAITLRGLDFVQIPTTLLAQVDSSVGGKTGINMPQGKNLIGAFHQPRLVLADIGALGTLPPRDLRAGYAEVVKYGLINDADFFTWLETNGPRIISTPDEADMQARRHAVLTSCRSKAAIVSADETEQGVRALLNLGHTFGHALEAKTGYGETLSHGESVAIGTVMAFDLSVRMGLCPTDDRDRIKNHLTGCGLPVGLDGIRDDGWSASELINLMGQDKKVTGGKLTFILARGIGQSFITDDVDLADVTAVLDNHLTP